MKPHFFYKGLRVAPGSDLYALIEESKDPNLSAAVRKKADERAAAKHKELIATYKEQSGVEL